LSWTLDAVGTALQQDEFGFVPTQIIFHQRPDFVEHGIVGKRGYRYVQLGTLGDAAPGFVQVTGAGVKRVSILVDIGKQQIRIIFETVKHAITMMGVNIDVGDALDAVLRAQVFDCDAAIVEYAKPRSHVAAGVM